ncbi:DUF2235 domain-containing protein (plasmid) [Moraxella bovis]|uniref:DUF2235 domain-containing protein n=1 Tax=Moraxella bovis TaxID=476 RepID=A0ABY6MB63_MORBO|nr:DUF2235 domain-containing protein [Moraxella bovis]UZA04832.1 DUF2235 domain-containing protein [Moraxella bovis]
MVGYLYDYLDKVYQDQWDEKGNYKQKDKPININLDIVGFSRGAASARMFASKVQKIMNSTTNQNNWYGYTQTFKGDTEKRVSRNWIYTKDFLAKCGININFNFMGLWDTVPAYGMEQGNDISDSQAFGMNLDVSNSKFKTIVHAVAMNENRYQFSRRSIYTGESQANSNNGVIQSDGKYRLEKGFLGAHSDIGGGYGEGDLSNVALMWMIKQAQEKGNIKLKNYNQYNKIENPIVHDSVMALKYPVARVAFTPGSQFFWAKDDKQNYEKYRIFNNVNHLSLNWEDTKAFQNPNYKKFDEAQERTEDYMAKNKSAREADYKTMLVNPRVHYHLQGYKYMKEDSLTGLEGILLNNNTILINADDPKKVIQIGDYIDWLNCNYGLNLVNNSEYDSSTGYSHPNMDVCFNSAMKYSFSGK